jgi:hypothetical protein
MSYHGRFEIIDGNLFRFDTRIYFDARTRSEPDGTCVTAVIGKNPGSATATPVGSWAPLELSHDQLLPSLRNRFLAAYAAAKKKVPDGAYVRVWNLFYLCDANLNGACEKLRNCVNASNALLKKLKPHRFFGQFGAVLMSVSPL